MNSGPSVLVTGGSVAGPAAAWALTRAGFAVTMQERAPGFREAGQNIDIRDAGHDVLRAMGIHDAVAAHGTGEVGLRFFDQHGRPHAEYPLIAGRDGPTAELEILRGQLSELLVALTDNSADHRYGTHIVALGQDDGGVDVEFADGTTERHDLVVVAEGRRSRTRDLLFGDEVSYAAREQYIAYGTIARTASDDDWWNWLTATGNRMVSVRPDNVGTIRANLAFLAPRLGLDLLGFDAQMLVLRERFAGVGWHTDRILDGFAADPSSFYLESTDGVVLPRYSQGRVIVVGDAAWSAGPTGMGTTLALVAAYVLAGELDRARTGDSIDHVQAFARYEAALRPYANSVQGPPRLLFRAALPRTTAGLAVRRAVTTAAARPAIRTVAERLALSRQKPFVLPRYPIYG